jgi:c-di-GMP-binding flagellar brake protein YcgR
MLFILGGMALCGIIAFRIVVSIKYSGMRYNWFSFRREGFDFGLDKHDVLLLRNIAYESRVPDFSMMYSSTRTLDNAIIRSVERVRGSEASDETKHANIERIFLLRNKMDNIITSRRKPITLTSQIRRNQPLDLRFEKIGTYQSYFMESTEQCFAVAMPKEALDVQDFTWEGKKVRVKFYVPNDAEYTLMSRVLDQAPGGEDSDGQETDGHITIEHTDRITRTQKRVFRRNTVSIAASMYTIKVTEEGNKRKITVSTQAPMSGTIVNLSAGGLSLRTTSSIKENVFLKLDFSLDFESTDVAIARVLAITAIPNTNERLLHMRFERISRKTRNNIFEYIYRNSEDKKDIAGKVLPPSRGNAYTPSTLPKERDT